MIMYLQDLADATKMVNLLTDHICFTQAYIKTAAEEQHKHCDSYDHSECFIVPAMACLTALTHHSRGTLRLMSPMTFACPLHGCKSSKLCKVTCLNFKTMKCELENLKLQQYQGQNIADMSLDVTYHCQALTTAGTGTTSCA